MKLGLIQSVGIEPDRKFINKDLPYQHSTRTKTESQEILCPIVFQRCMQNKAIRIGTTQI